jgi:hypothetical protein
LPVPSASASMPGRPARKATVPGAAAGLDGFCLVRQVFPLDKRRRWA